MPVVSARLCAIPVVAALVGCGGVSEERVAALEAQLAQIKKSQTAGAETSGAAGDVGQQIATLKEETNASIKKMEEMLEILQREVTATAAAAKAGDSAPQESGDTGSGAAWYAALSILGAPSDGLKAEENKFEIKRGWLLQQVDAMAASGKGPRFAPSKKGGIVVRGVKPKGLAARLGLTNNDLITAVGDTAVSSLEDLAAALAAVEGSTSVRVRRKKKELLLEYTLTN